MTEATLTREIRGLENLKYVVPDEVLGCRTADDAILLVKKYADTVKDVLVEVSHFVAIVYQVLDEYEFDKFRTKCVLDFRHIFSCTDQVDIYLYVGRGEIPGSSIELSYQGHCTAACRAILKVKRRIEDGEISEEDRDAAFKEALEEVSTRPIENLAYPQSATQSATKWRRSSKGGVMTRVVRRGSESYIESSTGATVEVVWDMLRDVFESGNKKQKAQTRLTNRTG